ncbi:MAG: NUDIX hydrolase [Fusobacteriaceae bacterium]|nr:NUDIX hydrolase [Fusobacteriaceae bacterium]
MNDILKYIKRVKALAQNGLAYCENPFDIERYEELKDISISMLNKLTDAPIQKIEKLFTDDKGYQTPKVDVRAVIINEGKLLMVKEKSDGKWSLPGGWCDIGYSPSEMAKKEVFEEAGYKVEVEKLLALLDKECHGHPEDIYHIYKLFFQCKILDGEGHGGTETSEIGFFSKDKLPELSLNRNTKNQIMLMFDLYNTNKETVFD